MSKYFLSILLLIVSVVLKAQSFAQITHYSVDDGLSENHVLCMLQDKKGLMWMGTFDGLNQFDGYTFRNFKGRKDQKYQLFNYRIDRLKEDQQGFLWIQTNDGRVFRFDPSDEAFLPVPQCCDEFREYKVSLNRSFFHPDGSIWLCSSDANADGCFRITNGNDHKTVQHTWFSMENGELPSNTINKIYPDAHQNTWFLTSKGLSLMSAGAAHPQPFAQEKFSSTFYSITESASTLFMGGENGLLLSVDPITKRATLLATPVRSSIIDIQQLSATELLLVTQTSDFVIYSTSTDKCEVFHIEGLPNNRVYGCYKDRHNHVWIDTDFQGAILFDPSLKAIFHLPVEAGKYAYYTTQKFYVVEDAFDHVWVQVRNGGLYQYNEALKKLEPLAFSEKGNSSLSSIVHTSLTDNQGNLWLSTYLQGVDKVVFKRSAFQFIQPTESPAYSMFNEIRSVYHDQRNWLWVGTKKGIVYVYDAQMKPKGMLCADGKIGGTNPLNIPVYDMKEDQHGSLWLATKGMGVFKLVKKTTDEFAMTHYSNNQDDLYSISSNAVYTIFEDRLHHLWFGTFGGGINLLDESTGNARFISNRNLLKNYPIGACSRVRYITEDLSGNLWIGTTQGVLVSEPGIGKPDEMTFHRYVHQPEKEYSLSGSDVQYILPSKKGDIYLALTGGGMNVIRGGFKVDREPCFELLKNPNGASSVMAYTLKEDRNGNIWISSQTQIVKYNPGTSKFDFYKPYSKNPYFFSEAAACETGKGDIVYGTSDGLMLFDPSTVTKSAFIPRICFTQLQLFNRPVAIGEKGSPLKTSIDNTCELVLKHKQNIISISYAALDYSNPQAIQYAYKMDGLETSWNFAGNQRTANYINLPKGKYTFRVKSTNGDGEWTENEKSLTIVKLPSFWESAWGFLFYFVVFILLSALVSYILFVIFRLRNEIAVEHRISDMKIRFFTDISHELRTPLTLIVSPIENLMRKEPLSESARAQIQIVQRNTNRLLRLINQILDFRKVQNRKMKLIVEAIPVSDFIKEICLSFQKLAEEKSIALVVTDNTQGAQLWADKDKFEKIFFNLISNAFKFTRSNHSIEVIISETAHSVTVTVHDQGVGISNEKLRLLFDRFESFANPQMAFQASTGIGLSLTKELVELHGAKIEVESETGKGTSFHVIFRKGFDHFGKKDEIFLHDLEEPDAPWSPTPNAPVDEFVEVDFAKEEKESMANDRPVLVLAEDNKELQGFLHSTLRISYDVYVADNGIKALELASSINPDLIVSDIMMPDMDGLELVQKLKESIETSHIPIVLLTAKTDIESKLEALEMGVDDYITKPFSLSFLEARIENLLKIRTQLQSYFKTSLTSGIITLAKPQVTNLDELFMSKTLTFLEVNYRNSEISIDDIAQHAGVSRSSFFKKLKSLTGLAPVDFIREFRIQKAAQLIEAGETNVSQIAYNVGINDTRYFSKCFKQKYGINPSEAIAKRSGKG